MTQSAGLQRLRPLRLYHLHPRNLVAHDFVLFIMSTRRCVVEPFADCISKVVRENVGWCQTAITLPYLCSKPKYLEQPFVHFCTCLAIMAKNVLQPVVVYSEKKQHFNYCRARSCSLVYCTQQLTYWNLCSDVISNFKFWISTSHQYVGFLNWILFSANKTIYFAVFYSWNLQVFFIFLYFPFLAQINISIFGINKPVGLRCWSTQRLHIICLLYTSDAADE